MERPHGSCVLHPLQSDLTDQHIIPPLSAKAHPLSAYLLHYHYRGGKTDHSSPILCLKFHQENQSHRISKLEWACKLHPTPTPQRNPACRHPDRWPLAASLRLLHCGRQTLHLGCSFLECKGDRPFLRLGSQRTLESLCQVTRKSVGHDEPRN